jgi:hypothetical protein
MLQSKWRDMDIAAWWRIAFERNIRRECRRGWSEAQSESRPLGRKRARPYRTLMRPPPSLKASPTFGGKHERTGFACGNVKNRVKLRVTAQLTARIIGPGVPNRLRARLTIALTMIILRAKFPPDRDAGL